MSKGNMLDRIYNLKEAVALFLECQGKDKLVQILKNYSFQLSLAYLTDIFEALDTLNLKLQGTKTTIIDHLSIYRQTPAMDTASWCQECLFIFSTL
jgi:hypothetical protein